MSISFSARTTRTAISPRFAMRTFPNAFRSSPPDSSRTTGTPRASCQRGPRARAGRRGASRCGSEGLYSENLYPRPRAAPRGRPLWPRPPRGQGPARSSKRDVPVLARRALGAFGANHLQRLDEVGARLARVDDVVYVAHLGCDHRVVELLLVRGDELPALLPRVLCLVELAPEDHVYRRGRAHDRDLTRRPRDVDVGAYVLGAHDVVSATVGLARDDGHLGHSRLGE